MLAIRLSFICYTHALYANVCKITPVRTLQINVVVIILYGQ